MSFLLKNENSYLGFYGPIYGINEEEESSATFIKSYNPIYPKKNILKSNSLISLSRLT